MSKEQIGDAFIVLSAIAVILAVIGVFGSDLWLASTQWILVAIALVGYGIYARMR